jgi:hypothetical protein
MSQDPAFHLHGTKIRFKLSAQWTPSGSCLNTDTIPIQHEFDISSPDNNYCLAYAVLGAIKYTKIRARRHAAIQVQRWANNVSLLQRVRSLIFNSGCRLNKGAYDLKDVERIQVYLNRLFHQKYQILVFEGSSVLYQGPVAKFVLPLRLHQNHYTCLKSANRYLKVSICFP